MKILMLPTWFGGISWWRFELPARALRARGHEVTCATADQLRYGLEKHKNDPRAWLRSVVEGQDLVHSGYTSDPFYASNLFQVARDEFNVPVITDLDDDLDNVPTYNRGWMAYHPGSRAQRTAKAQIKFSDAATFSTEPLVEAQGHLNPQHAVLGNWIDPADFCHSPDPSRGEDHSIRLMVTGGGGRYGDWEIFEEPLKAAMAKYDGKDGRPLLRLFFIGGTPHWVAPYLEDKVSPEGNRVFYIQPSEGVPLFNQMVQWVSPDIIMSPTVKNQFNRSKSGLKFLEASLAGAAFMCTDWDTYSLAPKGTCLRLDNTRAQWSEGICALVEDPSLRKGLAQKAKEYVLDACTIGTHIGQREEFYQRVLSGRVSPSVNSVTAEEPTR